MIKFGLSTRLYLFGGPEELRPAEGLSKMQRRQLAALEVCAQGPPLPTRPRLCSPCASLAPPLPAPQHLQEACNPLT